MEEITHVSSPSLPLLDGMVERTRETAKEEPSCGHLSGSGGPWLPAGVGAFGVSGPSCLIWRWTARQPQPASPC